MELNYNDIKNELESLKSSNYEEFLINMIVILRTSKEAILKLKKINNANRFYHYLDSLFFHIAFLLGIITKDNLEYMLKAKQLLQRRWNELEDIFYKK